MWLKRRLRSWFSSHKITARPAGRRPGRPGLEALEDRTLLTSQPVSVVFDAATGSLTILASAAGTAAQVAGTGDGAVLVSLNGQLFSGAVGSSSFDPALAEVSEASLRQIYLAGGGSGNSLTLADLTDAGSLAVITDGSVLLAGPVTVADSLTVTAASLTISGAVRAAAATLDTAGLLNVEAGGSMITQAAGSGGSLTASAADFVNVGQIRADGAHGGMVTITAPDYLNAGTVSAGGTAGAGGTIQVGFTHSYIDTTAAVTSATGVGAAGGQVAVNGGSNGRLVSSGRFLATGTSGGDIDLLGQDVFLIGTTVDASGAAGEGGRIRVGGDYQGGNPAVPNARTVDIGGATLLRADGVGAGGRVVVWSESSTAAVGRVSARNTGGGVGGFIEISSHGRLTYAATADAGTAGTLLLDPKNLVISAAPTGLFPQYNLVNPAEAGYFGASVVALSNGNFAVTDPSGNGGAAYLFNGQTGALISALTGLTSNGVGATVTALTNGNYVVDSPDWGGGKGAVTWANGTTGISGTISADNSLVGSSPFDHVGALGGTGGGITALPNGDYVVDSPNWGSNGSTSNGRGAVTWGDGTQGTHGVVSSDNSLVGSTVDDLVGGWGGLGGVTVLTNGNYVVDSVSWGSQNGMGDGPGAVTWCNGATGTSGVVSQQNSLVGSILGASEGGGDSVGWGGVKALTNGNYVVDSPQWNGQEGAVTWGDGTRGVSGPVSADNSLVGGNVGQGIPDMVGSGGVTALSNGNYVVVSPQWSADASAGSEIGAVTWGDGTTGIAGPVSMDNSLVGANADDLVGGAGANLGAVPAGVTALSNGNYVVDSPDWGTTLSEEAGTGAAPLGAVTWEDGTVPATGTVSAANSLIGYNPGDQVTGGPAGQGGVTGLTNGNYVVDSWYWSGQKGAATWADGTKPTSAVISSENSLVGSSAGDEVGSGSGGAGSGGVTALTNGNYVVDSPAWNASAGAVTLGNGATGTNGTISDTNSLIGSASGDTVGGSGGDIAYVGVTALPSGNYVVLSPSWHGNEGAVTWASGTAGVHGTISSANSLVNFARGVPDAVINVDPLPNGNYVVFFNLGEGQASDTWVNGATGATLDGQNKVDAQNSLMSVGGAVPLLGGSAFVATWPAYAPEGYPVGLVTIGFTDPNLLTFAMAPDQTVTVTPDFLTRTLNAGTDVTLQANNDITVNSPITETPKGAPGSLTLQAGRSILLNADIRTAGGNLTLIANDTAADGVVAADRDPGAPAITGAPGVTLDTGSGTLTTEVKGNQPPVVTAQPSSQTVVAGSAVTLTAAASGTPVPGVQWQVSGDGGKTFGNISGATATTLTFTAQAAQDGDRYRAVFSSATGQAITNAAVLSVEVITSLVVSAPSTATAGTGFGVSITARDQHGHTATAYNGSVTLSCSDGQALSPTTLTLANGTTAVTLTLDRAEKVTFTAGAGALKGTSGTLTVSPAAAASFAVSAPGMATAGAGFRLTLAAIDPYRNMVTSYTGTATLTSSDGQVVSPGSVHLVNGTAVVTATLGTADIVMLTAAAGALSGTSGNIVVGLALGPASLPADTAGHVYHVTISAGGGSGNYSFALAQGSVLPPGLSLSSAGVLSGTTTAAGTYHITVTATDTARNAVTGTRDYTLTVSPAPTNSFVVIAPATATAGASFSVTITAKDTYGNTTSGYSGTVTLTSSDRQAVSPATARLTNGTATVHVALDVAHTVSLTAAAGTVRGSSGSIAVAPAVLASLAVAAPAWVVAGQTFGVTVTAKDRYGNGWSGSVALASSSASVSPTTVGVNHGSGKVVLTAASSGAVRLTASASGVSAVYNLTVRPPAVGYAVVVAKPSLRSNEVDWYLKNTSSHTISVTYQVTSYHNGSQEGPVDTFTIRLIAGQSHNVAIKILTQITGDVYTQTVNVLGADYLN
jgi:hypothetical protein